jgi:hypothetical protein
MQIKKQYTISFLIGIAAKSLVEVKLISTLKVFQLKGIYLSLAELQKAVDEEESPDTIKVTGLEYWNMVNNKWW